MDAGIRLVASLSNTQRLLSGGGTLSALAVQGDPGLLGEWRNRGWAEL